MQKLHRVLGLATHKMHLVTSDPDNRLQLRELALQIRKGYFKTG